MKWIIDETILVQLESIRLVAPELARELGSKAGYKVQRSMRANMLKHKHHWFQRVRKGGEIHPFYNKNKQKRLGLRTNSDGTQSNTPKAMANFITNYMDEKNGVVVVGGTHRGFRPILRRDGQVIGKGSYVKGIGNHSQSILHKLDTGRQNEHHGWWRNGKFGKESFIEGAKFRGRGFMQDGLVRTSGVVNSIITTEYDRKFMQTQQNKKVKVNRITA